MAADLPVYGFGSSSVSGMDGFILTGPGARRALFSAVLAGAAAEVRETMSDSLSWALSRELSQWGLFPDTLLSYKALFAGGWSACPPGWYAVGSDSIFIVVDSVVNWAAFDDLLPHELTHALQDQYFPGIFGDSIPDGPYAGDYG